MAKLVYSECKTFENVIADKRSPNGVKLVTSRVQIQLWRFRIGLAKRFLLCRNVWDEGNNYLNGFKANSGAEWLVNVADGESEAIRKAIGAMDDFVAFNSIPHADMADHPAYRDVAPAPLALVEA